jgi:hypothetical protein
LRNNFMNLELDFLNYPLCRTGFVSNLFEVVYRITEEESFSHFDRLFRNSASEKNANIKNISLQTICSCTKVHKVI